MDNNDFTLKLNGASYKGWTEMSLSRSMEQSSGSFRLSLTSQPEDSYIDKQLMPGVRAEILLNGQATLIGYVDQVSSNYDANMARLDVVGRDKVGDLIDCAATVDGPFEYHNQRLDQVLDKILSPFDIPVSYADDVGAPFKRLAIQPGETAFELIERLCRFRSLLPISDGVGGLIVTKPARLRSSGRLVYGENILEGSIDLDYTSRFSLVVVKGQEEGTSDNTADDVAGGEGRATDALVTRYRPKVIVGENPDSQLSLIDRAAWDVSMNRARSVTARYKVQGWTTDGISDLWMVNTIVMVKDPLRGLNREMLIKAVGFERSLQGTYTTLELVLPDAFDIPAEAEPETDILGGL